MKKVIFVCLLTLSVCLSQPADKKDAAADGKTAAQSNASLPAGQQNKTATENPPGTTVTIPTTTNKTDSKNETTNNTASGPADKNGVPSSSALPNAEPTPKPDPTPVPDAKPESKTEKAGAKTDTTDNKTDKGENKTDKTDSKTTESPKPSPLPTTKPTAPSATPPTLQARGFDGASFVGGIILTLGLLAIGFMGFKYYKAQTERNYHTL